MLPYYVATVVFGFIEGAIFALVIQYCVAHTRRKWYLMIPVALLTSAVLIISNSLDWPHLIKSPLVFLCLIVIVYTFYRAPVYKIIFYVIAVFYINLTASLVVGNIHSGFFHAPINELTDTNFTVFITFSVLIHVLQIAGAFALIKFGGKQVDNPKNYWFMLDAALILSYYLSAAFFDVVPVLQKHFNPFVILAAVLAFFAVNALMVVLFIQISNFHVKERQTVMIELMAKHIQEKYHQLKETNHEFARIRHEWKKHLSAVIYLLRDGKVDEAIQRLDTVSDHIPNFEVMQYTGNDTFDFVISHKIAQAAEQGIRIDVDAYEIGEISIEPNDIISVLANLIDNAIEATMQLDTKDRHIILHCTKTYDLIIVTVQNKFVNTIKVADGNILTSKSDTVFHGYGITIVRNICEKYGGALDTDYINHEFHAHATMHEAKKLQE